MKIIAVIALLVPLAGCGWFERGKANWSGYSKICVEGVSYLQFPSGVTVQVDRSGNPVAC